VCSLVIIHTYNKKKIDKIRGGYEKQNFRKCAGAGQLNKLSNVNFNIYVNLHHNGLIFEQRLDTYRVIYERLLMKISLYATQNTRNP
jgi:hypothetical protein